MARERECKFCQRSLKHESYFLYDSELARTFKSKNHIRIKVTRHRVMDTFEKEYHSWMLMFYQVQWWCLKKMFIGEVICHLKRRLKSLCYYKWKSWYKLLSCSGLKKILFAFFSSTASHPLRETQNIAISHQVLCSSTLKTNELKVYISLKENKLVCFTNSLDNFHLYTRFG